MYNSNPESEQTTYRLGEHDDYLIAWTSEDADRGSEIHIYGNPAGLRNLANKLIAMADFDQRLGGFPDDDSEHHHYGTGRNTNAAATYPLLTIGRVDMKNDADALRDCFPPLRANADTSAIA